MTTSTYSFANRHIGPSLTDTRAMLATVGVPSIETLISQAVPKSIRLDRPLALPEPASEAAALAELAAKMDENVVLKSFIGAGYHGCLVPPVIQRNLFENPAWYTAYTPYQAEISQGRLEMLFNFQTLVAELTGLPVASASLLDEATAAAEAVGIAFRHHREKRHRVALAGALHPQVLDVVRTRAEPLGIVIDGDTIDEETAALLVPWPDTFGVYADHGDTIAKAKAAGALVVFVADPLALTLAEPPASLGADIAVGSMQRFGVPMGYGGPHAAYCAVSDKLTRLMPGRLVGQSTDAHGRPGYRLALQTREQHIRRDKATSNICTAQALLANMAASYAIWHGPEGLQEIAGRVHALAARLAAGLREAGIEIAGDRRFDTVTASIPGKARSIAAAAEAGGRLLRALDDDRVSISFDETSSEADLSAIAELFGASVPATADSAMPGKPRGKAFLTQPVFHENRSETEMMRLLRRLADKDLALDRTMIPLGSCTMKLNAAAEMMPVSWATVADMHPFAPKAHSAGYRKMFDDLEAWLAEITGFDAVSLQPNAGSQGEYAGLLAIRAWHRQRGDENRTVCLIPSSAHGTNPASASMAGMDVVVVRCTDEGDIDVEDLRAKAARARGKPRRADDHLSVDAWRVRGRRARHLRAGSRAWRPGLSRRRQPQRAGRACPPGRHRRRRLPHEPAQDVLHPAWRRRTRHRTDRRQGASGAVPARPCHQWRRARGRGRPLRQRLDPADHLDVYPHDGCVGAEAGDRDGDPQRQLHGRPARRPLSGAVQGPQRARRA